MAKSHDGNIYHRILKLPKRITQPDCYLLLGLERFEDDPIVIKDAALDRNRLLQRMQNAKNYSDVKQLEREIAMAMVCLTNPESKAEYDRQLTANKTPPVLPPLSAAQADALVADFPELRIDNSDESSSSVKRTARGRGMRKGHNRTIAICSFIAIVLLLAFLLRGVGSSDSTTSTDYTSGEVREIVQLLCKDPACRDTRLGEAFAEHRVSLELLDAILGQPVSKAGSYPHMIWTYKTADGTATISPYRVYEDEGQTPGSVPHLVVQGGVQILGLDSNRPVDREALKSKILRIKKRFDPEDGVEFEKQLAEKRSQERAAEEEELRKRDAQEQKEREELNARLDAEREAEIARRREQQRQQDAETAERQVFLDAQRQAEREYYDLRDALPVGREKDEFAKQHEAWVSRRIEAIQAVRAKGEDWKNLPLPKQVDVAATLRAGKPVPVVPAAPPSQEASTATGGATGGQKPVPEAANAPKQAVTKGSFTVWTVPEDPQPGKQYVIMIQVNLKNSIERYPRSDLAGNVVGTDGYKDYFGGPTEAGYLPVMDNTVRMQACVVPGAAKLVKDVITVESKILKEKQVIDLVFLERLPATDADTAKTPSTDPEPTKTPPAKTVPKKPATKSIAELTKEALGKRVSLTAPYPESYKGAPRDKLAVQYAVMEIAQQVGLRYDFQTSQKNTDPICRRWVQPNFRNQSVGKALNSILQPNGLTYSINAGVIVLKRR